MENKDIIYNNIEDLITPIDTSAKDLAFEADAERARRQKEERDRIMNQPIDITAKDLAFEPELERALEEDQAMYKDIEEPHIHR